MLLIIYRKLITAPTHSLPRDTTHNLSPINPMNGKFLSAIYQLQQIIKSNYRNSVAKDHKLFNENFIKHEV